MNRRKFLAGLGVLAGSSLLAPDSTGCCAARRRRCCAPFEIDDSLGGTRPRNEFESVAVNWRATDSSNHALYKAPSGNQVFSLFAYMVSAPPLNPRVPTEIKDSIIDEVQRAYNAGLSASIDHYYRPTGFLQHYCILGSYAGDRDSLRYVLVSFLHTMAGSGGRFSRLYDDSGVNVISSWGWETYNLPVGQFFSPLQYADCDRENGLGFAFHSIRQG